MLEFQRGQRHSTELKGPMDRRRFRAGPGSCLYPLCRSNVESIAQPASLSWTSGKGRGLWVFHYLLNQCTVVYMNASITIFLTHEQSMDLYLSAVLFVYAPLLLLWNVLVSFLEAFSQVSHWLWWSWVWAWLGKTDSFAGQELLTAMD